MARRALILLHGAASNGLLYVQAAQRLGLHPITLSADPAQHDCLAGESVEAMRADTNNLDALIRECSRLRAINAVAGITSADEKLYATVGKLCRHFDLPGPNPASIEQCCDKFTQRQLLAAAGVPIPAYRLAATATEVESAASNIGLPVILKPAMGAGSSGVRLCRDLGELAEHTSYLLQGKHICRSSPRMLVEQFAQGPHYSADIMGNEILGVTANDFGPPPHFVYRESIFPAPLTDEENERIADVSLSCLRALGLGWGPTNIEFRWTKRGPVVIEVNPRLVGGPQLVQLAYGIDLVAEHIKLVIGEEWDLTRRYSHVSAYRSLLPDSDGILEWIDGESRAAALPGVSEVKIHVRPKTLIVRKGDYRDSMGYFLAVSPNLAQTKEITHCAIQLINWSITPLCAPVVPGHSRNTPLESDRDSNG
ncbi:acetyl-CoA carboxylase biotin carboxylase subunit family protein [Mesorhizobium sp.]|uniref:ATP-grasp domain-containing protein n=1 Tax=Mesorhizobium sp. TaxID=1871066 RepID=UPI000FEAA0DF|nr:acetyl-CoA carboxylase biotin carboxylase subunit family protein [Mesorhizobium sp.]RWP24488.1 MAG: ATP-grasp domain-containing protein [Mesorhizobium sp.]